MKFTYGSKINNPEMPKINGQVMIATQTYILKPEIVDK